MTYCQTMYGNTSEDSR